MWRVEDPPTATAGHEGPDRSPEGPAARRLVLQDPEVAENCMEAPIPAHLGEPGHEAAVRAMAAHPHRRTFRAPDGSIWTLTRTAEVNGSGRSALLPPREVEAACTGRAVTVALPGSLGLGEVTEEELLDLLG